MNYRNQLFDICEDLPSMYEKVGREFEQYFTKAQVEEILETLYGSEVDYTSIEDVVADEQLTWKEFTTEALQYASVDDCQAVYIALDLDNGLIESKMNENDDAESTDGTLVNQLEFEVQFIYNELKDWLRSFKDTEFSVYKGIGGTETLPEYYIRILDREDDVARELLFYEDEGDIYLKMWYGSSIRKSEHAKTYELSTIKNIPEFCKDIIMDIRSHKILYPKTSGYIKPKVEESIKLLRKAGYLVERLEK